MALPPERQAELEKIIGNLRPNQHAAFIELPDPHVFLAEITGGATPSDPARRKNVPRIRAFVMHLARLTDAVPLPVLGYLFGLLMLDYYGKIEVTDQPLAKLNEMGQTLTREVENTTAADAESQMGQLAVRIACAAILSSRLNDFLKWRALGDLQNTVNAAIEQGKLHHPGGLIAAVKEAAPASPAGQNTAGPSGKSRAASFTDEAEYRFMLKMGTDELGLPDADTFLKELGQTGAVPLQTSPRESRDLVRGWVETVDEMAPRIHYLVRRQIMLMIIAYYYGKNVFPADVAEPPEFTAAVDQLRAYAKDCTGETQALSLFGMIDVVHRADLPLVLRYFGLLVVQDLIDGMAKMGAIRCRTKFVKVIPGEVG